MNKILIPTNYCLGFITMLVISFNNKIYSFTWFDFKQINAVVNLKSQSAKMGKAFASGDFIAFANYTYPPLLNSMGGSKKMVEVLNKTVADMKSKGMSFSKITVDEPTKIIQVGKELQSTINQHTEIKLSQGRVVAESTLIAISIDNGVNWKFIDTSNKDIATLRKAMPNLSSAIVIPAPKPPVRYSF